MHYNELNALKLIPNITIRQYGLDCFIKNQPTDKDIAAALKGLEEIKTITTSKEYDVVILDELCIALYYKLFDEEEIIKLIRSKTESIEMIITGRYASERLISEADLVTEMKEIKHYYNNGQSARKGIEY
jgi:cob(I)alamin adenosyltransferase